MAATLKPTLPFGSTEWSTDWSTVSGQNQMSWGTWEVPVASPPPIVAKTSTLKSFVPIQPPSPLPAAAFVPIASNSAEGWTPMPAAKTVVIPVVQSPPVIAPSSFVDVTDNSEWTVPAADTVEEEPTGDAVSPLSAPQRSIKLRQAGANVEVELRQQDLYKTEYCRSWRETGACRYGTKCQFAHGEHELRPVLRHPKYKTEICRNFSETGTCPYGTRCRFVHYQRGRSANATLSHPNNNNNNSSSDAEAVTSELRKLSLDSNVPVATEESKEKSKGSRLPFFQKLRRNTSAEKDNETSKGR